MLLFMLVKTTFVKLSLNVIKIRLFRRKIIFIFSLFFRCFALPENMKKLKIICYDHKIIQP